LSTRGFGLRDGCWDPVSAGATDPHGADAATSGNGRERPR